VRDPRPGIGVASDGGLTIVLDSAITPELAAEGLAREFINRVQGLRRDNEFDVADRVTVGYSTGQAELASAIETHSTLISEETLATDLYDLGDNAGSATEIAGHSVQLLVQRS
jgi:isoleucyl-tRNA synthetase